MATPEVEALTRRVAALETQLAALLQAINVGRGGSVAISAPTGLSITVGGNCTISAGAELTLNAGSNFRTSVGSETRWPSASRSGRYAQTNSRTRWRMAVTLENGVVERGMVKLLAGRRQTSGQSGTSGH